MANRFKRYQQEKRYEAKLLMREQIEQENAEKLLALRRADDILERCQLRGKQYQGYVADLDKYNPDTVYSLGRTTANHDKPIERLTLQAA